MDYKMNVGNELAQIKYCKDIDEIKEFLEKHNLKFDHWYLDTSTFEDVHKKGLYVVAYYQDLDGISIHLTFNF